MADFLSRHLLSLIVFLPMAGAALLLLFPSSRPREATIFALCFSILAGVLSLPLWFRFDLAERGFQFRETLPWVPSLGISYAVGIDGISLVLVLLTTILTPVSLLFSVTHLSKSVRAFSIAFLTLETGVLGTL